MEVSNNIKYNLSLSHCWKDTAFIDLFNLNKFMTGLESVSSISRSMRPSLLVNLTLLLLLLALLQVSQGLHMQAAPVDQTPNTYTKNIYLGQLSDIQTRFQKDLQQIKKKFTSMNVELSKANMSPSSQFIKIQQTLAQERDALFNIQKYLALPFALKSCECINFAEADKKAMQQQIVEVTNQINNLEKKLNFDDAGKPYDNPKCPSGNCPVVQEMKKQISQLQNYAKIMTDTVTSACCDKINYVYRDNLVASTSWVYGTLTEKTYRDRLIEKEKTSKMSNCPQGLPFANEVANQCFACPTDTPIFNLETRACMKRCEDSKLILNPITHNCDYNRTCPAGQFFNSKTLQCQIDLGSSSRCPQDKPVWNDAIMICQQCPANHPYFDLNILSCRSCTLNQIWDDNTKKCQNKATYTPVSCPSGYIFNRATSKCDQPATPNQANPTTPPTTTPQLPSATGTSALCPPDTPYWNQNDFVCSKCPEQTPNYNAATKQCEQCPVNTKWNSVSMSCISAGHNCQHNEFWNQKTNKCEQIKPCNADETYNKQTKKCERVSQTGIVGICPPESPYWNSQSLFCQKCPSLTPMWSPTDNTCKACAPSTVYDAASSSCKNSVPCPSGLVQNPQTKQCEQVKCPSDKPILNTQKGQCEACPQGSVFNPKTGNCEQQNLGSVSGVCSKESPVWNNLKLVCEPCPSGQTFSQTLKKCQKVLSHFSVSQHE